MSVYCIFVRQYDCLCLCPYLFLRWMFFCLQCLCLCLGFCQTLCLHIRLSNSKSVLVMNVSCCHPGVYSQKLSKFTCRGNLICYPSIRFFRHFNIYFNFLSYNCDCQSIAPIPFLLVCVLVCACVCVCTSVCAQINICVCVCVCVCVCECMYVCMYVCVCKNFCVCVCLRACVR